MGLRQIFLQAELSAMTRCSLGGFGLLSLSGIWQWSVGKQCMSCKLCRWLALTKLVVCKGPATQVATAWQLMTWGLAQAGNRAGRTGRYLQWWDSEPEWNAVTSALQNPYDAASFLHLAWVGRQ